MHRNANGLGSQTVVANRLQAVTKRRVHQAAQDHKHQQRDAQGIPSRRLPKQIKFKAAQHRAHDHALQTIGATGEPVEFVGQLLQDERHTQGDHDAGQVRAAQHAQAANSAQHRRDQHGDQQAQHGIGVQVFGKQGRGVSAHAKKRRMAQRHDAAVAQNQIERHGEQGNDGDFADEQRMSGHQPRQRQQQRPQGRFPPPRLCQ